MTDFIVKHWVSYLMFKINNIGNEICSSKISVYKNFNSIYEFNFYILSTY